MENMVENKTENMPKSKPKKDKGTGISLIIMIVVVSVGMFLYNRSTGNMPPTVIIDGIEMTTGNTVQDVVDAGFQIRLSSTGGSELAIDSQGQIPGESYSSERFYIYVQNESGSWECTDVSFSVYNTSVNSVDFAESKIYRYVYDVGFAHNSCDITINGVDFDGMTPEEALTAFEEAGIKFEEEEREEFLEGETSLIYGIPKEYKYILYQDYDGEYLQSVEVGRRV